jgi:hypothetical protein
MARIGRLGEGEVTRSLGAAAAGDLEAPGHPQVHYQCLVAIERRQQVLGAAVEPLDPRAGEALDEAFGQREAQVRTPRLDPGKARTFQHGRQATPHGLDLREFGHALK